MRLKNLLLLIAGYGGGQGSIFLAQTWLISQKRLGLVSDFGISFYIATLAIMFVDFGSTIVLARETAAQRHVGQPSGSIWPNYFAVLPVRILAAGIAIVFTLLIAWWTGDQFARDYAVFATPALAIWAFNATGLLDGLKMSGMNGLTGAIPFVSSGLTLAAIGAGVHVSAGACLGASLSVGYALALAGQGVTLAWSGHPPKVFRPSRQEVLDASSAGFGAMMSALPGQLYFRLQILLAGLFLGTTGTALFLYAKQIVVGFAQIVGFLRRIEFPDLVRRVANWQGSLVGEIMAAQRVGTIAAAAGTALMLGGGLAAWKLSTGTISSAGQAAAIFSPIVFTSAIALSFTQALAALKLYHRAAGTIILAVAAGSAVASCLSYIHRLQVLALADITSNIVTISLAAYLVSKARPVTSEDCPRC